MNTTPLDPPGDWRRHLAPVRVLVDRTINEQHHPRLHPAPPAEQVDFALLQVLHQTLKALLPGLDPAARWTALQQARAALDRAQDAAAHIEPERAK